MVTDIDTSELTYLASLVVQEGFSEGNMYSVPAKWSEANSTRSLSPMMRLFTS